ncbi:MAG: hypothetical protein AB8I08_06915 [Sandaracinaceae bacterium]
MRPFARFAARDAFVALVCGALWFVDATLAAQSGALALAVGMLTGFMTVLVAFFGHEWGHLTGALLSGATVHAPPVTSPFLFHFDVAKSTRRQFLAMSYGGYLASLVGVLVVVALVPWDRWSGWTAMLLVALGLVVTAALEIPAHVRVMHGGPLPRGAVYVE